MAMIENAPRVAGPSLASTGLTPNPDAWAPVPREAAIHAVYMRVEAAGGFLAAVLRDRPRPSWAEQDDVRASVLRAAQAFGRLREATPNEQGVRATLAKDAAHATRIAIGVIRQQAPREASDLLGEVDGRIGNACDALDRSNIIVKNTLDGSGIQRRLRDADMPQVSLEAARMLAQRGIEHMNRLGAWHDRSASGPQPRSPKAMAAAIEETRAMDAPAAAAELDRMMRFFGARLMSRTVASPTLQNFVDDCASASRWLSGAQGRSAPAAEKGRPAAPRWALGGERD